MSDYYKISISSEALQKLANLTSHTPPKETQRYIPKEEKEKRTYEGAKERKEQENLLNKEKRNQLKAPAIKTQIKVA